jgi:hypothetical protein
MHVKMNVRVGSSSALHGTVHQQVVSDEATKAETVYSPSPFLVQKSCTITHANNSVIRRCHGP